MSLTSVIFAQSKIWKQVPEAQAIHNQLDRVSSGEKLHLFAQLAHHYSQKIFQTTRPDYVDSETKDLEAAKQALENLNQACKASDIHQIKIQFCTLPNPAREFLLWGIWIEDSLGSKPLYGIGHGWARFNSDAMVIGSQNAKKVIYTNGSSLVEQLLNYTTDALSLKYQEQRALHLDPKHPEQKKLAKMQLAQDLIQYDKMIALKPFIITQEQKHTFESYLSPRVLSWLKTPNELFESRGAHQQGDKTIFSVYAPQAQHVQCLLTAFGNIERIIDMQKQADGTWTASIDRVNSGKTYLYRVTDYNGKITDRADPFSFGNVHVRETDAIHSVVVDRISFAWTDVKWLEERAKTQPLERPLSIYEVHIKSWTNGKKNLRAIAHELAAYCKELGSTHVELYGIMEHFWGKARGYQVSNFFAPYHDVGSYEDMKYFVNHMHQEGLGVILDWIPAHYDYGSAHSRHLGASLYRFDGTDLFGDEKSIWGTMYVDYSKPEAQRLMEASAFWWLKEFHVDAIRVDAVSQLVKRSGRDVQAGIDFLAQLNDKVHAQYPGVLMIAEATDWDPRICRSTASKGFGFDLNWAVGASHNLHNYLKTPEKERSKPEHHRDKLERIFREGQRPDEKKIATHSHDDMDSGVRNHDKTLYNLGKNHSNETERLGDIRNFFSWQIFGPNWGHLFHMGDELSQPESWYARLQMDQSAMQWECLNRHPFSLQKDFVKDAIHLYKSEEGFWKQGGANSELVCSHESNNVIAYARGKNIVVHNFSNKGFNSYDIPVGPRFREISQMNEKLNSDATRYGGSGKYLNGNATVLHSGDNHRLNVKLPPRSTLVFIPK